MDKDIIKEYDCNIIPALTSFLEKEKIESYDVLQDIIDIKKRNICINEITDEIGTAIEYMIRFYNEIDNELGLSCENREPIKIWINSDGGSLDAAFLIFDAIKLSKTPVLTINLNRACSSGALIFLAGHRRIAFPKSFFLLHEGSIGINQIDAHKFRSMSEFYKTQLNLMEKIILENTSITQDIYESHSKDDWWITSDEAISYNIADEIMSKELYNTL